MSKYDAFISYSSIDANVAKAVCHKLEENGIRCWIAPRDIKPGDDWALSILEAIKSSKVFVLIFSDNSNKSEQVPKELTLAVNYRLMIFPFKISNTLPEGSFEYLLSDIHWLDAINKPMDLSIEHMKNVIALYLNSDSIEIFTKKRDEEEQKLSNKIKRRYKSRLYKGIGLFLCLFSLTIGTILIIKNRNADKPNRMEGYSATLFLMRYKDVDSIAQSNLFTDSLLQLFSYDKDFNDKKQYYIYPKSKYISYVSGEVIEASGYLMDSIPAIAYHFPVIQVRLNSHAKETITMSEAVLEISDLYREDQPAFRFNVNKRGLQIYNENYVGDLNVILNYSSLLPGESFMRYKKEEGFLMGIKQNVTLKNHSDSIVGELGLSETEKVQFTYGLLSSKSYIPRISKSKEKIPTYYLENTHNQEIVLRDFNRSLKENETDVGYFFKIASSVDVTFKMRLKIKINGKEDYLYSNSIFVRLACPRNGKPIVF